MADHPIEPIPVSNPPSLDDKAGISRNKIPFSIQRIIEPSASTSTRGKDIALGNQRLSREHPDIGLGERDPKATTSRRRWLRRNLLQVLSTGLTVLGLAFLISNILLIFCRSTWDYSQDPDNSNNKALSKWDAAGMGVDSFSWYPTDFLQDVIPIPAHSHNDYWRTVPLFSAIRAGCTGVEADVWQLDDDHELYVGHDLASLTNTRTFKSLYINPLVELLKLANPPTTTFLNPLEEVGIKCRQNGVFDRDRYQSLVLLVDVKSDGLKTWPRIIEQLRPLRERGWLSYVDGVGEVVMGPVTVVGTGNTPFESILGKNTTSRDVFFDAPLDQMFEEEDFGFDVQYDVYNNTNSFYASASIGKALGPVWFATGGISEYQLNRMRGQIRGAHRRGLKVRYWSLPAWPRGFRNEMWKVLVEEGVDYLNVDDIKGASLFNLEEYVQDNRLLG